jgi:hypothetical protein
MVTCEQKCTSAVYGNPRELLNQNVIHIFRDSRAMPSNSSGCLSFVAVSWMTDLLWKAFRHGLTEGDLYDLQVSCMSLLVQELYLILFLLLVILFNTFHTAYVMLND